jgi:diguanylate cyclase (GGDEF)-like protein/PAS domain S-box-containing protein
MSIRLKLISGFSLITLLVGILGAVAVSRQIAAAKILAMKDAENIAASLAASITHERDPIRHPALYKNHQDLQDYIEELHRVYHRDIEVIDIHKKIIADVIKQDIGITFAHDRNNEVAQTLRDGITRTFTEVSESYPEGIRQIVFPLKNDKGKIIGALLFEYTPLYNELVGLAKQTIKQIILASAVCLGLAILLGLFFSGNILRPIKELQAVALEIVNGNLSAQANIHSKDEIGEMALAFNKMTNDLTRSNEQLQAEITERQHTSEERDLVVTLLDTVAVLVIVLDREGRIIRFNLACQQTTGYALEEVEHRHIWEVFLAPEEVVPVQEMFQQMLAGQIRPVHEVSFLTKEGNRRLITLSYALLRGQDGEVAYVIGTGLDITAPRRTEEALRESEARYRLLAENSRDVIWRMDLSRQFTYVSPAVQLVTGYTPEEYLTLEWDHTLTPAFLKLAEDTLAQLHEIELREKPPLPPSATVELEHIRKDGTAGWVEIQATLMRDLQGEPTGVMGVTRDITDRRKVWKDLERANARLQILVQDAEKRNRDMARLNDMSDMLQTCQTFEEAFAAISHFVSNFFPTDAGALYLFRNSRNLLTPETSWGQPPPSEEMFAPEDCWALRRGRVHQVADPAQGIVCKHIPQTDALDNGYLCVPLMAQGESLGILHIRLLSCALGRQESGELEDKRRLAVAIAENLALALANLKLRESLQSQAIRDPLTGLYNRRYLEETMDRELHRARRQETPLGMVMMDLDHFKKFNDTFGHGAGDALLSAMANLVKNGIREEDIVCRYGGEEFLLIMPGASLEATRERAENLRRMVKNLQVKYQDRFLKSPSISLGVALFPDHGSSGEELIAAADAALYRAKQAGRDRVKIAA